MTATSITPAEFSLWAAYVHELCGIVLDQSKAYLLESRLGPLLHAYHCDTYLALYDKAKRDTSRQLPNRIIDAISTNETFFFRDVATFALLKSKLLPAYLDRAQAASSAPTLRIWSAACATGQEAYSLAITLHEFPADLRRYRAAIVGTDISDAAIAQAGTGCYNRVEIERGLSPSQARTYFAAQGASWRIHDSLRALVSFRKLNLLEPLTGLGTFDFILCRNVAIYFSQADRRRLFDRLAAHLHPTGALLLGATESLLGVSNCYIRREYHNAAFYQLAPLPPG